MYLNVLKNILSIATGVFLVVLIHEVGHAIAIKLLGGQVKELNVGKGKTIFNIGNFSVKENLFGGSCYEHFNKELKPFGKIFMFANGVITTFVVGATLAIITNINPLLLEQGGIMHSWLSIFILLCIFDSLNLLPIKGKDGLNSDGWEISKVVLTPFIKYVKTLI